MSIDNQLSLWDMLLSEAPQEQVPVEGIVNLNTMPISDYKVRLCYGDLKLIVAMIEDYIRSLDVIKKDDIQWNAYYRKKFKAISARIQEQIEYDYDKAMLKCQKHKEDSSDIGEEAFALAIKRQMKEKSA